MSDTPLFQNSDEQEAVYGGDHVLPAPMMMPQRAWSHPDWWVPGYSVRAARRA